jgi:DNA-binding transcriptional regulator YiaG
MEPHDIKALRKELKVTQQKLADFLGVHVTTVTRWERGQSAPDTTTQLALAMTAFLQQRDMLARFVKSHSH